MDNLYLSFSNKENSAERGFVSAIDQQDNFWSYVYRLFVCVYMRSHIVPKAFVKAFTQTKETASYQMFPAQCLISTVIKHWTQRWTLKSHQEKEEVESSDTQIKILTSQSDHTSFLLPALEEASDACEKPSLVCFINSPPSASVPKAFWVPGWQHSGTKKWVQLLKLIPTWQGWKSERKGSSSSLTRTKAGRISLPTEFFTGYLIKVVSIMLSAKAKIFSYTKQKKCMYVCSVTEIFYTSMACFQLLLFPTLTVKFHMDLMTMKECFAVTRVIA